MAGWATVHDSPAAPKTRSLLSSNRQSAVDSSATVTGTSAGAGGGAGIRVSRTTTGAPAAGGGLESWKSKPTKEQLLLRPRERAAARCGCGAPTCEKCGWFIFPSEKGESLRSGVIALFALYNTVYTPIVFAFDPKLGASPATLIFDYGVDLGFIAHLILLFITGYFDDFGRLVYKRKLIKDRVMNVGFSLDVLASIPFEIIALAAGYGPGTQFFALMRCNRGIRCFRLYLSQLLTHRHFMAKLFRLLLFLLLTVHWAGCLFWSLGALQTNNKFTGDGWAVKLNLINADIQTQYTNSFYWSLQTLTSVGYGDIVPTTNAEKFFACIIIVVGCAFYAIIFANIAMLIQSLENSFKRFRAKESYIREFAILYRLPEDLTNRLIGTTREAWNVHKGVDMPTLVRTLPEQLRAETLLFLHSHLVEAVPMFSRAPRGFIEAIVTRLHTRLVMKGEYVVRQGELSNEMWFVSKGSVEVLRRKGNRMTDDENSVGALDEGAFFGEIGLLFGERRTASVRALENSELCSLSKHQLDRALEMFPETAREIMDTANKRRNFDAENDFMLDFAHGLEKEKQQTAARGVSLSHAAGGTGATEMRVIAVRDRKEKPAAAGAGGPAGSADPASPTISAAPVSGGFDRPPSMNYNYSTNNQSANYQAHKMAESASTPKQAGGGPGIASQISISGVVAMVPPSSAGAPVPASPAYGPKPPSPALGPSVRRTTASTGFGFMPNGGGAVGFSATANSGGGGGGFGNSGVVELSSQLELITATLSRLSERLSIIERSVGKISEIKQTVDQILLQQTEAAHARS